MKFNKQDWNICWVAYVEAAWSRMHFPNRNGGKDGEDLFYLDLWVIHLHVKNFHALFWENDTLHHYNTIFTGKCILTHTHKIYNHFRCTAPEHVFLTWMQCINTYVYSEWYSRCHWKDEMRRAFPLLPWQPLTWGEWPSWYTGILRSGS